MRTHSLILLVLYCCNLAMVETTRDIQQADLHMTSELVKAIRRPQKCTLRSVKQSTYVYAEDTPHVNTFWRQLCTKYSSSDANTQWYLETVGNSGFIKLRNVKHNDYLTSSVVIPSRGSLPEPVAHSEFRECDYPFLWSIEDWTSGNVYLRHNKTGKYLSASASNGSVSFVSRMITDNEIDILCRL